MTGSKIGAANGTLIFMVGGDAATIDHLNPLFAAMGKKIFRMGETGKGQATKLSMNLQIALIYEGFAEALTLATKLGVDPEATGLADRSHHGELRRRRIQSAFRPAARLHTQFSAAPHA